MYRATSMLDHNLIIIDDLAMRIISFVAPKIEKSNGKSVVLRYKNIDLDLG